LDRNTKSTRFTASGKIIIVFTYDKGWVGANWRAEAAQDPIRRNPKYLSNHPELMISQTGQLKISASDQSSVEFATENSSNLKIRLFQGRSTGDLQIDPQWFYVSMVRGIMRVVTLPIKTSRALWVREWSSGKTSPSSDSLTQSLLVLLAANKSYARRPKKPIGSKTSFLLLFHTNSVLPKRHRWMDDYAAQRQGGSAVVRQGLEVIQRNALLQSRMIEELLDVSRIVAGR
jgi:hypothetical protein